MPDAQSEVRPLHTATPVLQPAKDRAYGFRAVLSRGDFRYLWAAQAASQLADKFLMFTLLIVVYDVSLRSTAQSFLMIAYTLPSVLLSAPAGVYADRHDKRILMIGTNVIRGGLILLIPLAQSVPGLTSSVWPLLLITLLFSSVGQIFAPAEAASIPALVRSKEIMTATSLFMTTVILTLVAGIPLATLSIRIFGIKAPFYIAFGFFIIAAICVALVSTPLKANPNSNHNNRSIGLELREGWIILKENAALRIAMTQLSISLVVVFTVFALGPAYLQTVLHHPPTDTYLVLIPATFGMVATALIIGRSGQRINRALLMVSAALVAGITLVGIGLIPDALDAIGWQSQAVFLILVITLAILFGCAFGGLLIPAFTVLQERTTEQSRGRIFGGIFAVINTAVAIPLLLAGGLADAFGVDRVVAGLGIMLIVGALVVRLKAWSYVQILNEEQYSGSEN